MALRHLRYFGIEGFEFEYRSFQIEIFILNKTCNKNNLVYFFQEMKYFNFTTKYINQTCISTISREDIS